MKPPIGKQFEKYNKNIDIMDQKPSTADDIQSCKTGRYIESTIEENSIEDKSEK